MSSLVLQQQTAFVSVAFNTMPSLTLVKAGYCNLSAITFTLKWITLPLISSLASCHHLGLTPPLRFECGTETIQITSLWAPVNKLVLMRLLHTVGSRVVGLAQAYMLVITAAFDVLFRYWFVENTARGDWRKFFKLEPRKGSASQP